ncbi:MAG TPA: ATP-binding protein, partial [Chitinophagales bacterium]|nr:ATP-binding protein [Chitinophagales bacterium]
PEILLQCDAYQGASEKQEVFLYRIVQELLTNSIKHGRAQQIKITLLSNNTSIQLEVIDNGVGFDPQQLQNAPGIGMKNIKTRIDLLNGSLLIDSTIGKGSKFNIILPK